LALDAGEERRRCAGVGALVSEDTVAGAGEVEAEVDLGQRAVGGRGGGGEGREDDDGARGDDVGAGVPLQDTLAGGQAAEAVGLVVGEVDRLVRQVDQRDQREVVGPVGVVADERDAAGGEGPRGRG
jgi:hypothetical protein